MPFWRGIQIVKKAYEEINKEKAWQIYLTSLLYMGEEHISFEEFYSQAKAEESACKKSVDEILDEVREILGGEWIGTI